MAHAVLLEMEMLTADIAALRREHARQVAQTCDDGWLRFILVGWRRHAGRRDPVLVPSSGEFKAAHGEILLPIDSVAALMQDCEAA